MKTDYARNYSDLKNPSSVSGEGAYAEYILPMEKEGWEGLGQGSTVIIEDYRSGKRVWLSGQVIEMKSLSPFMSEREVMLYSHQDTESISILDRINGPHSEQMLVAKVDIDVELEKTNGHYSQSPVQKPAGNRSVMRLPRIKSEDGSIPSIQDILGLKNTGVSVGYYGPGNSPIEEEGEFLPYYLDLENLDNKHMFIVGESGSGKTVLLKKLAHEFRKNGVNGKSPRVIMTDVQGDLLQLLMGDNIDLIQRKGWQKRIPESHDWGGAAEEMGKFQLILPVSKNQDQTDVAAIKKVVKETGHKVTEIGLRLRDIEDLSEIEYLLRLASEQAVTVLDDEISYMKEIGFNVELSKLDNTLRNRIREAENSDEKKNNQQIATSKGTKFYKSTFRAAQRGLRQLKDIFDHHEDSMLKDENPLNCLKFEGTSIFYLEHLDPEERLMWGMQMVKWLYDNKRESGDFFVFIDEAHALIPARPPVAGGRGTFERLRENFEKLAREGRKFGRNLILGTQSPKDLHEIVPQQCPTKIVMKINKTNSRAAEISDSEARIASRFGHGQMFLKSPFNGTADWIRIHSPSPPIPHGSMSDFWPKLRGLARNMAKQR